MTEPPRSVSELLRSPRPEDADLLARWLAFPPARLDDAVRARGEAMPAPLDAAAIAELRAAHARRGADAASFAAIDALASPNARVVVAGQQPGLLAGPLLTLYKAIAAVRLARDLAPRHPHLRFVPVFWVASEDDDFREVRRAHWPGANGELEEVFDEGADWTPGRMVGTLAAGPIGRSLVARIRESSHRTDFLDDVLARVERAHGLAPAEDPDANWEDAFCRLLLGLLPGTGLVVVSPLMGWVRRAGAPVVRREIETAGESTRLVVERGRDLEAAGFEARLHRRPDAVNAYAIANGTSRRPLRLAEGGIAAAPPSGADASEPAGPARPAADWIAELDAAPERFGFNVVSRPVVQDSILPTVAQIVGPGEAAYLAQVEAAYPLFGCFAPVRFPRPSPTLLPFNAERTLEKFSVPIEEALSRDAEGLARFILERDLRSGILGDIEALRDRHKSELATLAERLGPDPGPASAAKRLADAMDKGYATLSERVLYARQEDERRLRDAMRRLEHSLRPTGAPQDRVLNPLVPFVVNHGTAWIARLVETLDLRPDAPPAAIRMRDLVPSA